MLRRFPEDVMSYRYIVVITDTTDSRQRALSLRQLSFSSVYGSCPAVSKLSCIFSVRTPIATWCRCVQKCVVLLGALTRDNDADDFAPIYARSTHDSQTTLARPRVFDDVHACGRVFTATSFMRIRFSAEQFFAKMCKSRTSVVVVSLFRFRRSRDWRCSLDLRLLVCHCHWSYSWRGKCETYWLMYVIIYILSLL